MNTEPEITMSSLCRTFKLDGHSVQIEIYEGDPGQWILEVVDEFNNTTLWQEQFASDQLALEEALKAIDEEGIESLVGSP